MNQNEGRAKVVHTALKNFWPDVRQKESQDIEEKEAHIFLFTDKDRQTLLILREDEAFLSVEAGACAKLGPALGAKLDTSQEPTDYSLCGEEVKDQAIKDLVFYLNSKLYEKITVRNVRYGFVVKPHIWLTRHINYPMNVTEEFLRNILDLTHKTIDNLGQSS